MTQKQKKSRKIILAIVGLLVLIVAAAFSLTVVKNLDDKFVDEKPVITDDPRLEKDESVPEGEWIVAADEPRYMSIEKLGVVNARVVKVGIKSGTENQLDDPVNIHDVGWYNQSVKPGYGTGNMAGLYDGHNTGYSANGVFINLGRLAVGDLIKVERGDGEVFHYEVREVATPLLEEVDMNLMQRSAVSGTEGLNIISCGGDWDEARQTYTHRVTVRAVLASS